MRVARRELVSVLIDSVVRPWGLIIGSIMLVKAFLDPIGPPPYRPSVDRNRNEPKLPPGRSSFESQSGLPGLN